MTNNVERMPAFEYTTTGMTGAFTHAYSVVDEGMKAQGYDVEDGYKLSAVANPVLKEGDTPTALPLSAGIVGDPMYVSANVSDEEALGAWLNYCYSKEGAMLQGFGIEGVDYTINDNGDVEL
jgi:putative aldouronate transport system substrate-binding protein